MSRSQISSICRQCQARFSLSSLSKHQTVTRRLFSATTHRRAEEDTRTAQQISEAADARPITQTVAPANPAEEAATTSETPRIRQDAPIQQQQQQQQQQLPSQPTRRTRTATKFASQSLETLAAGARAEADTRPGSVVSRDEPYHLNVYAHKHNMHITFTEPSRNPILSFSAGNIGLRKAQRGSFDAAYQLATYTMRKMAEKQWRTGGKGATLNKMLTLNESEVRERGIEVVLRGFGPGREAFQKALLGTEGRFIKPLVKRVTDSTRLKFGGTRSRAVRRLG